MPNIVPEFCFLSIPHFDPCIGLKLRPQRSDGSPYTDLIWLSHLFGHPVVFLYMFCLNNFLPYYYEPVLATRFRSKPEVLYFLETGGKRKKSTGGDATQETEEEQLSKKEKKGTAFSVDSSNPPESVSWLLTDSSADTLTPFIHGKMVPEGQRQEWDAVFSTV
ncbi:hypothetical protein CQW23_26768 [Capsicum baccatum]|uniref:Uncharacterized protein n=1 Tax=Capsicum baccatum TaxID=33114 RepID=A0A2G2VPR5_CAPBA|nr:hypothetical protein CQW23_26768 [Capsicum baccatum]